MPLSLTKSTYITFLKLLRRPAPAGSSCVGVDLNRNWNVIGYGIGASADPCSEIYKVLGIVILNM